MTHPFDPHADRLLTLVYLRLGKVFPGVRRNDLFYEIHLAGDKKGRQPGVRVRWVAERIAGGRLRIPGTKYSIENFGRMIDNDDFDRQAMVVCNSFTRSLQRAREDEDGSRT